MRAAGLARSLSADRYRLVQRLLCGYGREEFVDPFTGKRRSRHKNRPLWQRPVKKDAIGERFHAS